MADREKTEILNYRVHAAIDELLTAAMESGEVMPAFVAQIRRDPAGMIKRLQNVVTNEPHPLRARINAICGRAWAKASAEHEDETWQSL
jgi:hypothetical protein